MTSLVDVVIRSAAGSLLLLLAGVFLLKHHSGWPGRCTALLAASLACHLACPFLLSGAPPRLIGIPVWLGCFGVPAFFWMFVRAIFDDDFTPGVPEAGAFAIIEAPGFASLYFWRYAPEHDPIAFASLLQLPGLLLVAAALLRAWSGYAADLIEGRRRFRRWLVSGVGLYMVVVASIEMAARGKPVSPVLDATHGAIVLALSAAAACAGRQPTLGSAAKPCRGHRFGR